MSLRKVANSLVAPGRGILAADESTPTVGKRLAKHGLDNTEVILNWSHLCFYIMSADIRIYCKILFVHVAQLDERAEVTWKCIEPGKEQGCLQEVRRDYRELFLTAPNIGQSLSGCILYKETLAQSSRAGIPFVQILNAAGILAGIKVDEVQPLYWPCVHCSAALPYLQLCKSAVTADVQTPGLQTWLRLSDVQAQKCSGTRHITLQVFHNVCRVFEKGNRNSAVMSIHDVDSRESACLCSLHSPMNFVSHPGSQRGGAQLSRTNSGSQSFNIFSTMTNVIIMCLQGLEPLTDGSRESHTKGLSSLEQRCTAYARWWWHPSTIWCHAVQIQSYPSELLLFWGLGQ